MTTRYDIKLQPGYLLLGYPLDSLLKVASLVQALMTTLLVIISGFNLVTCLGVATRQPSQNLQPRARIDEYTVSYNIRPQPGYLPWGSHWTAFSKPLASRKH